MGLLLLNHLSSPEVFEKSIKHQELLVIIREGVESRGEVGGGGNNQVIIKTQAGQRISDGTQRARTSPSASKGVNEA